RKLGNHKVKTKCPVCGDEITTRIRVRSYWVTWCTCCICCMVGLALCCYAFIPFCVNCTQRVQHFCPHCNNLIGTN
uniref:LITAF domain-containing protein n=1 Tax=Strigamia maritima TaxID=126957 RepID=T1JN59_STRMM